MSAIRLHPNEAEVVVAEAEHYASRVSDPRAQERYERVRSAAADGELPEPDVDVLTQLLEVGLASGRIRNAYGAQAEMTARGVYKRTPRGRALREQAGAVNEALTELRGHEVERISVAASGPGAYLLTVETDGARVLVTLDGAGVDVKSVEVSL